MFDRNQSSENTRSNSTFLSIVGLTLFALIFIAVYLQWNSFLTKHKNDELVKKLEERNNELLTLDQATRDVQFQYLRLRSLIQSRDLAIVHVPGNLKDFNKGTLLWDRQTQRAALLFDELLIPPDTNLCIWWKSPSNPDWKLATTITVTKPDTVYTRFDLPSFNKVTGLLFRFMANKNDRPTPDRGREIARVSLSGVGTGK